MKTSCFKRYTGDKGVAICIYPPIDWTGLQYPALEPDRQAFYAIKAGTITKEQYENWGDHLEESRRMLEEAGVEIAFVNEEQKHEQ